MMQFLDHASLVILLLGLIVVSIGTRMIWSHKSGSPKILPITISLCGLAISGVGFINLVMVSDLVRLNAINRNLGPELERQVKIMNRQLETLNSRINLADDERKNMARGQNEINLQLRQKDRRRGYIVSNLAGEIAWLQMIAAKKDDMSGYLQRVSGFYATNMEGTYFRPCVYPGLEQEQKQRQKTSWAVVFHLSPEIEQRVRATTAGAHEKAVPIHATGVLSQPGAFGHMNASKRLFLVIDAGPREEADCRYSAVDYFGVTSYERLKKF